MKFSSLFKNLNADRILSTMRGQNKLSHGYLITCKDGEFLKEFLLNQAMLIAGNCDCETCETCKSILGQVSPDFHLYPKVLREEESESGKSVDKKTLHVSDVEEIFTEAYLKPTHLEKKIFLILDFDIMVEQAQNKLLKLLEEPPQSVIFLVGTTNFDRVLPTVRSRLVKLFLPDFKKEEIAAHLESVGVDSVRSKLSGILAFGEISKGLFYANDPSILEMREDIFQMLENLNSSKVLVDWFARLGKYSKNLSEFLHYLQIVYRDILMIKTSIEDAIFFTEDRDRMKEIGENYSVNSLVLSIEEVGEGIKDLSFKGNPTMILESKLLKLLEVKSLCR